MAGPVPRRKGVLAFAKQPAKGTPAAAPVFAVPFVSGGVGPVADWGDLPVTRATAARAGQYKQRARVQSTVQMLAHCEPLGLLLYEAMGAQAVSGVGVPFLHTFTMADDFPIPMTVWSMVADQWERFVDVYVTKLTLNGTTGENVIVECDLFGRQARELSVAPTYSLLGDDPRFKYIGSTVKLEADTSPPSVVDNAESVILVIDRVPEPRYGSSLTPNYIIATQRHIDFTPLTTYDTAMQSLDFIRGALFGTLTPDSDMTQDRLSGSFDVKFGRHPVDATRFLEVVSNGANWEYMPARPNPDPAGGSLELSLPGIVRDADDHTTEITVTLANETSGLY